MDSSCWNMTNEFRWHARLQQNYNGRAAATGGRQESTSLHWHRAGRRHCWILPRFVWVLPSSQGVASHSLCFSFRSCFQAMLKQKSGCFCTPPILPLRYAPPCCSLCSAGLLREDNSFPGEEKPNGSIAFLPQN